MYQKIIDNGCIVGVVKGVLVGNITEDEYNTILDATRQKPSAPEGCDYRLREDMTWELYKLPEPVDDGWGVGAQGV